MGLGSFSKHMYFRSINCFSPNINIVRDPRWGRASETYGEDPYLTAELGAAYVKGLQGNDSHYTKVRPRGLLTAIKLSTLPLVCGTTANISFGVSAGQCHLQALCSLFTGGRRRLLARCLQC